MKATILTAAVIGLFATSAVLAQTAVPATTEAASVSAGGNHSLNGVSAWYGRKFAGRRTASGQRFNPDALTAAHPTLAFGSQVKVTNTKNNRSVVVVINDRGPTSPGRILDVSLAAAKRLGFVRAGLTEVSLEVIGQRPLTRPRKA